MAGYLIVTDDMALTPAGSGVVAKDFPRRSEVVILPAPSYAGSNRQRPWSAPVYNRASSAVARIMGLIAASTYAGQDVNLVCLGDSKTEGTGSDAGSRPVQSWPGVLQRMLGAVEGFVAANTAANDSRWNVTGMSRSSDITRNGILRDGGATNTTVNYAPGFAHTGGTFWVHCAAGGTVAVAVDGGAAQPITVAAGNGYKAVTPTVTGDSAHTYVITSSDDIRIYGHTPTYSGPRLKVSNFGRSGSTAAGWQPGLYPDGTGLWDAFRVAAPAPSAVLCEIGTNSPTTSAAPIASLWAAIVALNVPGVVIAPGGLGSVTFTDYAPVYQAAFDAADLYDLPLIDFQSVISDYTTANARGLMADTLHENKRGYAYEAAALASLLAPPRPA